MNNQNDLEHKIEITPEEERMLTGEKGPTTAKAMNLLLALAKIHGAPRFVKVKSVQVSGVSYHNLGDAGLSFLNEWAESGRASMVTATLNPAGMDLRHWNKQGISEDFAEKQNAVVDAYVSMGIVPACTCTPYLAGNLPRFGESIAWAESSAVTFANSVIGARTNREGGPAALAAALTGRTPYWGLHLDENRNPDVLINVGVDLKDSYEWGLLGAFIGRKSPGSLPYIQLGDMNDNYEPGIGCLKSLSASLPTFGALPMFHAEKLTPEAHLVDLPEKSIFYGKDERAETIKSLEDPFERPDLVCLGCPHATLDEMAEVVYLLQGRGVKIPFWLCTSRAVYELAAGVGVLKELEKCGVEVVCDTCFVVAPLRGLFSKVMTNSAKGCYYARGHNKLEVRIATTQKCVEVACRPSQKQTPQNQRVPF